MVVLSMFPWGFRVFIASLVTTNCNLYAAYHSWKAINTKNVNETTDWMSYWSVVGFIFVFEWFLEFLVHWLPFYHEVKVALFLFLVFNPGNGSKYIYDGFIFPLVMQYDLARKAKKARQFTAKLVVSSFGFVYFGLIQLAIDTNSMSRPLSRQLFAAHTEMIAKLNTVPIDRDDDGNNAAAAGGGLGGDNVDDGQQQQQQSGGFWSLRSRSRASREHPGRISNLF